MRKTLRDVAGYLKETMVPETQEAYAVNPILGGVATEEKLRAGVLAFRGFLARLYDALAAGGDAYDNTKKVAHEYENRISLSVYYPFLHNVKTLLMNMGYRGVLAEDGQALVCDAGIFDERVSVPKTLECLRFLAGVGILIQGMDLENKKQSLADTGFIMVSYPENPAALLGMKVMAIAEVKLGNLDNQDIFLRCDYRAVKKEETDVVSIVKDTIRPLPAEIQAFILQLHERHVGKGLSCTVEIKGFHIYIKYGYRRKDVWGLNASMRNGYHINVKPVRTEEYAEAIKAFPPSLQALIAQGYGCGRKNAVGHCDGGCRGLIIPLDASVLAIRDDIVTWLDLEVSSLQRKR